MKKIMFMLIVSFVIFVSCKTPIERKAKKQLRETMYSLAKNPDSYKIHDTEIKYHTDSLCIIHCDCSGQNGFGGYNRSKIEYIYLLTENCTYEVVRDLDDNKSIFYNHSDLTHLSKTDSADIESAAIIYCIFNGRKISQ
jgi:hypothetical protein